MSPGECGVWLGAAERRLADPSLGKLPAVRLIHMEGNGLRCDRLGPVCWFYWYRGTSPTEHQIQCFGEICRFAGCEHWIAREMSDRGSDPNRSRTWNSAKAPPSWRTEEHGLAYQLRSDRGRSPGLFLDQRRNRRWILEEARGSSVLNLFAYTGGFGLCAARGGAAEVVNVDSSRANLEWARENARLNGLDRHSIEFAAVDARLFIRGCGRRGRRFDLIVCDPPSFSRGREGVFRIERDLFSLLADAAALLRPGGRMLVCSNYEKWTALRFEQAVADALRGKGAVLKPAVEADADFDAPGAGRILKSVLVAAAG
ncbi:MAG: class I SAM-dependent methyltransferase [Gemmatimonadetes bacterium]|nr:class I SAM-dependent methyltransferase [Gemmatimonadota bacterium]